MYMHLGWSSLRYACSCMGKQFNAKGFPEVFTGSMPFHQITRNETVTLKVIAGLRPERPADALVLGLFDSVWLMVELCWQTQRDQRPGTGAVLQCFEEAVKSFIPTPISTTSLADPRRVVDSEDMRSEVFSLCESLSIHAR